MQCIYSTTSRLCQRRPQGPPSVALGLKILVKPANLASPIVHLCEQELKKFIFMRIHNSCTCNGDNLNLLIKTGNVHKERMLPQTAINICKKYEGEGLNNSQK